MDWKRAIEINRENLAAIVAGLASSMDYAFDADLIWTYQVGAVSVIEARNSWQLYQDASEGCVFRQSGLSS